MVENFKLYKKLAEDAQQKLNSILELAKRQLDIVANENTEELVKTTEKRGKLTEEFNLINEEMSRVLSGIEKNEEVMAYVGSANDAVDKLKNEIYEMTQRVMKAIKDDMDNCRDNIKNIAENKEALNSYGRLDYHAESTYFDKRNC